MMKVAVFSHEIPSTTFIENLITGLADNQIEVYLFGYKRKEVSYENSKIKPIFFSDSRPAQIRDVLIGSLKLLFKNPALLIKTYRTCFSFSDISFSVVKLSFYLKMVLNPVDIFHFQWGGDVLYYKEIFTLLDCKFMLSFRGAHINYAPLFRKELKEAYLHYFPKMSGFHAVSNAIAKESLLYGADLTKIKTIYTSVNPSLLDHPFNYQKEKSSQVIELLSVGRFHWKKGYNYAIDAVAKLKSKGIAVNYTIVAQGKDIEEFLFQIHQLQLHDCVKIVNGLPHSEVLNLMNHCDLFLLPSLEEGIANVVIEAMTIGSLVISTDCGGMAELISNLENGFLIAMRNSDAIADAVCEYQKLSDVELNKMRLAARKTIEKSFTRERMIREFSELYQKVGNKQPIN